MTGKYFTGRQPPASILQLVGQSLYNGTGREVGISGETDPGQPLEVSPRRIESGKF